MCYSGGDNQLAVVMGSYKAPSEIQCRGNLLAPSSCEAVLEEMNAGTAVQTFGPHPKPLVTVPLPYILWSGKLAIQLFSSYVRSSLTRYRTDDSRCQVQIFSTSSASASDKASWYEVWEATVAIWSVCVRNHKGGTLRDIGKSHDHSAPATHDPSRRERRKTNANPSGLHRG